MGNLAGHVRELRVYASAVLQCRHLFQVAARLPKWEANRLADQLVRSSRSVPALLAEAWGRRHYPRAFREKLSQALGEATEVQAWLDCAVGCGYLTDDEFRQLDKEWQQIGGMIMRMMQQASSFAGNSQKP